VYNRPAPTTKSGELSLPPFIFSGLFNRKMANTHNQKFTIWQMFSNIFVAAINKGQLPVAILGLLLIILFIRMPADDLTAFASKVLAELKSGYLLGYLGFIMALCGWFLHAKRLRRISHHETERIGDEKTKLQKAALPGKIKTSRRK
jgi:hypothetical protein